MKLLDQLHQLIDQHIYEHRDIAFYEAKLGLKPKYLSKVFKKADIAPPCQILIDRQLQESQQLLLDTDLSIKEIAFKLGFEDPYYFSRLFKEKTAMSPSQYREVEQ